MARSVALVSFKERMFSRKSAFDLTVGLWPGGGGGGGRGGGEREREREMYV